MFKCFAIVGTQILTKWKKNIKNKGENGGEKEK